MDLKLFIRKAGLKRIGIISIFFLAVLAVIVYANYPTWDNPTSCVPQPPSSGWTNCANANTYDGGHTAAHASVDTTTNTLTSVWRNFNFNIPSDHIITGVVVRLDATGRTFDWGIPGEYPGQYAQPSNVVLQVRLSQTGGATWTAPRITPLLGKVEQTYLIDMGSNDPWLLPWAPADFSNGNFRVEVTCNQFTITPTPPLTPHSDCDLDWVSVEVKHKAPNTSISIPISIPTRPTLAFVSDETVLQRGDWLQTEEQFVAHQGNPSQYTMIRNGAVTGISIHCERAPSSCSSNPTVEARITAGGNVPVSTTPVISVALPNNKYAAYNTIPTGTAFSAGDTISVYAQNYGTCTSQPAWCTVLVETSTIETVTISIPLGGGGMGG